MTTPAPMAVDALLGALYPDPHPLGRPVRGRGAGRGRAGARRPAGVPPALVRARG